MTRGRGGAGHGSDGVGGAEIDQPSPGGLVLDGERQRLEVFSRGDGLRDGADPYAELAVLTAASGCPRAALYVPVRLADVTDGETVARPLLVTALERRRDGGVDLQAWTEAVGPDGAVVGTAVDDDLSPVASLLYDALLQTQVAVGMTQVAAVVEGWGHEVLADPPLASPDRAALGRDRYRVHRLARELTARHRATARARAFRRPAVPTRLPAGFVPACPF